MRTALALLVASIAAATADAQCGPGVQKLLNEQRFDDARGAVQALIAANGSDAAALHCMGRVYVAMDKPGDAVEWFEKAVKVNDNLSVHHLWLANALGAYAEHANKLKLPFLARRIRSEFERASQLDPSSIDARHGLIQFYSQAPGVVGGSMDRAKEQAIEIQKLNAMRGHVEMAALLERDKDLAGAEREFAAALAAAPDSNPAYNGLASFYRRQKRYGDAVEVYERLLKRKPDVAGAHFNIGVTLVQSGQQYERAERELERWIGAAPADAAPGVVSSAHYFLGIAYERQAKKDSARAEYQRATALDPKNEDAKKALAALR